MRQGALCMGLRRAGLVFLSHMYCSWFLKHVFTLCVRVRVRVSLGVLMSMSVSLRLSLCVSVSLRLCLCVSLSLRLSPRA